ncbi:hypothetical protein GGI07_004716 [Coemansia sp. Benny D115]|nr:hypothetical protein GGI07_004716 [Coemansia sp. Benny D115]
MPLSERICQLAQKFSSESGSEKVAGTAAEKEGVGQDVTTKCELSPFESTCSGVAWSTANPISVLSKERQGVNPVKVKPELFGSNILDGRPLPTNAWWQNLVLNHGDNTIVGMPYLLRSPQEALVVCAPTPLIEENHVCSVWHDDWKFVFAPGTRRQVVGYDPLSVTLEYRLSDQVVAHVPAVRGAAFVTVVFERPEKLVLSTVHAVMEIDGGYGKGTALVRLNNGATWLVCCEQETELVQDGISSIVSQDALQGSVRLALVSSESSPVENEQCAVEALLQARGVVPIGGKVDIQVNDCGTEARFKFSWKTRSNDARQQLSPLMCTMPHHVMAMDAGATDHQWVDSVASYWTSRGRTRAVQSAEWQWVEQLEPLGFSGQTPLSIEARKHLGALVPADAQGLTDDPSTLPQDPYFFGKALARAMRIALIADEIGDLASCDVALSRAKQWLQPWLDGTNTDCLLWDTEWQGFCSKAGLADSTADFGQGIYNDHHFHYGYFVYAAAALAKLAPEWVEERREILDIFARDYCNTAPNVDRSFPLMRCFDYFDGHSYASGLYEFGDSRNQESTSEAINAYYAAYLYAQVTGRQEIARYVQAILQLEARTSRIYWHLDDLTSDIYPEEYAKSKAVVGILWSTKADYTTFFGDNPEFIYGIQFLPYTPASALLLKREWVADIWPRFMEKVANDSKTDSWREIIHLAYAVVDKEQTAEWNKEIGEHDDGNSASNSYYWIATAPVN